jgi:plasmid maintenance system antidote protein VapI
MTWGYPKARENAVLRVDGFSDTSDRFWMSLQATYEIMKARRGDRQGS